MMISGRPQNAGVLPQENELLSRIDGTPYFNIATSGASNRWL